MQSLPGKQPDRLASAAARQGRSRGMEKRTGACEWRAGASLRCWRQSCRRWRRRAVVSASCPAVAPPPPPPSPGHVAEERCARALVTSVGAGGRPPPRSETPPRKPASAATAVDGVDTQPAAATAGTPPTAAPANVTATAAPAAPAVAAPATHADATAATHAVAAPAVAVAYGVATAAPRLPGPVRRSPHPASATLELGGGVLPPFPTLRLPLAGARRRRRRGAGRQRRGAAVRPPRGGARSCSPGMTGRGMAPTAIGWGDSVVIYGLAEKKKLNVRGGG